MPDPFTIRIFVPSGDPEGVRFIDKMNWTGLGVAFPRGQWPGLRAHEEVRRPGVYILAGYSEADPDMPKLYIGQGDDISQRVEAHFKNKEFWDWGVCFVSTGGALNRAHVTWLEYALVDRAMKANRAVLDNGNKPQEPSLTLAEKADTQAFLKEILQILPLVGVHSFENPRPIRRAQPGQEAIAANFSEDALDTIVVPAQVDGFRDVFLGQSCWHAVRIAGGMLDRIKYIAGYQTRPISAVTHFAEIDRIEPYGNTGKYKLVFVAPAQTIGPIEYGDAPSGAMQGARYTSREKLLKAGQLTDLF